MNDDVTAWIGAKGHLPEVLRDFAAQRDVFRCIGDELAEAQRRDPDSPYLKDMDWIKGQVFTMDLFLRFMARHGYVLRRGGGRRSYADLSETVVGSRRRRTEAARAASKEGSGP